MSQVSHGRSKLLSTIYNMLPGVDDDYAAKLVYTLEDKKTLEELQQDIADLAAQLNSDSAMADTLIAKMLLDECTLAAALRQLRIYNNSTSITELCAALNIPAKDTSKLLEVYASFSSHHYFDEAFEQALEQIEDATLSDQAKAKKALNTLLEQTQEICKQDNQIIAQNRTAIFKLADTYHLSVKLTAELELLYSQPASVLFQPIFEHLLTELLAYNPQENLCASLAARTMLMQITAKDAQDVATTASLLNNKLLEEDLLIIACRYLKSKTPKDIADAYDAVLKKLPYIDNPEENLGLAVRVLIDGTPMSLQQSIQSATLNRNRELLYQALTKNPLYDGYEYELAQHYANKKTFEQLNNDMHELLEAFPCCTTSQENKELACKVLLGMISLEDAHAQACYMQNIKAHTNAQGITPRLLQHYSGTQSAAKLSEFFTTSLKSYTFWKVDRKKHLFALHILVEELNGVYDHQVTDFILDMLENGSSVDALTDILSTVSKMKVSSKELQPLLEKYRLELTQTTHAR